MILTGCSIKTGFRKPLIFTTPLRIGRRRSRRGMECSRKTIWVVLVLAMFVAGTKCGHVHSKGECAPSTPDREAFKMIPCMSASKDADYPVSQRCCDQVRKLGQSTSCLCAVMLSKTAEAVGSKPEIAITIPKRCNIAERPVGYNCGGYILP